MSVGYCDSVPAYISTRAATICPCLLIGTIFFHFKWSQAPILKPPLHIVYTIGLILLSLYSQIFLICASVGILSLEYLSGFGNPLDTNFQSKGIFRISRRF